VSESGTGAIPRTVQTFGALCDRHLPSIAIDCSSSPATRIDQLFEVCIPSTVGDPQRQCVCHPLIDTKILANHLKRQGRFGRARHPSYSPTRRQCLAEAVLLNYKTGLVVTIIPWSSNGTDTMAAPASLMYWDAHGQLSASTKTTSPGDRYAFAANASPCDAPVVKTMPSGPRSRPSRVRAILASSSRRHSGPEKCPRLPYPTPHALLR
jgi:hypothetical protein